MKNSCKLYNCIPILSNRRGVLSLVMLLITSNLMGGVKSSSSNSERVFSEKIYFSTASSTIERNLVNNSFSIDNIARFLSEADTLRELSIEVIGSASPEGNHTYNISLAKKRASALCDYFRLPANTGIKTIIHNPASESSWPQLRYAEFRASFFPSKISDDNASVNDGDPDKNKNDISHTDGLPTISDYSSPNLQTDNKPENTPPSTISLSNSTRGPLHIIVGTNLLYDAALIPNIGIGICLNNRYTLWADWMYAWWSNRDKRKYWRIYGGDIEVRIQLGHGRSENPFSGHRIGAYASILTYDIQAGRSHTGIMGDKFNYAAGISYGYSLPISSRLNLDFSIGIGYMWGKYMKQHLVDTHDVWQSTHNRSWFGPTKAEIGLSWLIGDGNINTKSKRGGRK